MLEFYHPKSPPTTNPKSIEIQPKCADFFNSRTSHSPKFPPKNNHSISIKPSTDSNFPPKHIQSPQENTHLFSTTNSSSYIDFPVKIEHSIPPNQSTHSNSPLKIAGSVPRKSSGNLKFQSRPTHKGSKHFPPNTKQISSLTLQILTQIYKLGPTPDIITYTTFIKYLGDCGHADEASELFAIMKETHDPDVISFTVLIQILCNCRQLDRALDLIQEMPSHNCKPDVFCYNTLINKLGEAGHEDHIRTLWSEMQLDGIRPNIITYSSLVKSLCIVNKINEAISVMAHMETCGNIKLNTYVYNTIMMAYLDRGQIREALGVLGRMEIRGCCPDSCSFNLFIRYFSDLGHGLTAYVFLKEMVRRGVEANEISYKACALGLIKEGKVREVFELIEETRISCVSLSVGFWNNLILWFGKMGKLEEAYGVFMSIKNPNEITMNIVINMFYKHGRGDIAWDMFNLMGEMGIRPSIVTYNILVHGLGREGRTRQAAQLVGRMELDECLSPDVVTYNCLLDGLCRAGEIDGACRLVLEMVRRGCGPDLISYNTLINGLISVGRLDDACSLFEHMRGKWDAHVVPLERLIMEMVERKLSI
ncbi:pentatricopeptide repeat-containing protein At4g31850, chloroplastic-like [Magnolia sinica]|uniref:pentatricopeptide repeat-containing protein At4g31850, chloroplastic-like n=1 Tax=Magnolia sinica TaxID=86752 RepID=UPI00265A2360|nr:pentatricopeptide repeat-containing protein At4g31850, chloroplastic-like [Magnolia sinica]